jgi:folate-dependent phosphoribosylglycinamide formyltransferase PurN
MVPVGALTLPSWDRRTLLRKVGQWGWRESLRYARAKLTPGAGGKTNRIRNPYLETSLRRGDSVWRNLHAAGEHYGFPVVTCRDQNSTHAISEIKRWSPDILVFTGGNILRDEVLRVPRLGVLNAHLALLPEVRGMSSPEWSLLCDVPLGITIHFMDSGVDTGPIVLRREFTATEGVESLTDLRNRMIAEGIELLAEAIAGLDCGTLAPMPQRDREKDSQYFVMHESLKAAATRKLKKGRLNPVADRCDG